MMPAYETLTAALNDLKQKGYTTDFNLAFDTLQCKTTGQCLRPDDFEITEHYRFEGDSNPSDEEVVYAITAKDGSMKGTLVSAFGTYSDAVDDALLQKLQIN